jgi:hypothetical protein
MTCSAPGIRRYARVPIPDAALFAAVAAFLRAAFASESARRSWTNGATNRDASTVVKRFVCRNLRPSGVA